LRQSILYEGIMLTTDSEFVIAAGGEFYVQDALELFDYRNETVDRVTFRFDCLFCEIA